jgi:hypothetical protein
VITMATQHTFAGQHGAGSAQNFMSLKWCLTVSAVKGGATLRQMERLPECGPISLFYWQPTFAGTAHVREHRL